jgi:hypothetical protein
MEEICVWRLSVKIKANIPPKDRVSKYLKTWNSLMK